MYGIDKSKLSKIFIEQIDLDKIKNNTNVSYTEATSESRKEIIETTTKEYIELETLTVKDSFLFDILKLGFTKDNIPYCTLELTIHDKTDNNLRPQSVSEFQNRLKRIKEYLQSIYGIYISYEYAIFSSLEINITQKINYTFNEYYHILTLMQQLASKYYNNPKHNYTDTEGNISSLYLSNNSTEIKIYNKTKQLDNRYKITVKDEYMRIEYKLKSSQRVARAFGSNKLNELTDEQIINFLHERIYNDLIKNLEKHIEYSTKQLEKLFNKIHKENKHNFIKLFISEAHSEKINNSKSSSLDLLFDIEQIINIVSNYDKKHKKRNTELIKKQSNKVKFHNNFNKLEEIKLKFTNYKKEDDTQ
ncbi:hypothetical protein [Intestinibacter bartlettii]|uniref:Uncharacterized protein n=1 Tax=Intestinibacter bartlettii TaxID=261299 RepID=A0ABS6E064_9FIRM|nr:hypothetical protein [Intestinibacter bartlettii]MBU5337495.1 hypothetical protein [Intestinibacter bartlettii]